MGTSRDSFYRIKELYNTGDEEALREISRRKPIPKNRVEPKIEVAVVQIAFDFPVYGQTRACNELRKRGFFISAAGVIPFFERQAIPVLRMLTDRRSEFKGRAENHEYELYLQLEDIEHSRTKVRHPQSDGICERLYRTMQDAFYATTFGKKMYNTLKLLQTDLDEWLAHYNEARPHSGRYCFGKTPMQTFVESLNLAKAKMLEQDSIAT